MRSTWAENFTNGLASVVRSADENRLLDQILGVLLAGGHDDRRPRHLRVVEHAHGVAQPRRDMQVDHGKSARGLRIAIRHRHQRGLLQAQDVADVVLDRERVHQRQLGGAGVAEHDLHALLLEQIEERALSGHHRQGSLQCCLGVGRGSCRRFQAELGGWSDGV